MIPLVRRALVLSLVLLPACTHGTYGRADRTASRPVEVDVINHNWMDMVVYAERDGSRVRLGMVRTENRARFRLPRQMILGQGKVTLIADPVGADASFQSDPLLVFPGARVMLSLENQISLSAHWVEPAG